MITSRRRRSVAFRIGVWPLLTAGLCGLVLAALSAAALIGLAFVGLLAPVVGGRELLRGRFGRPARAPLGGLDHPVVG